MVYEPNFQTSPLKFKATDLCRVSVYDVDLNAESMDAGEENRGKGRIKPAPVVINPPLQTEEKLAVETQPTQNAAQGLHQAFPIQSERDRRIKIASIVVLVSMFFQWGYHYWLNWTINLVSSNDGEGWDDGYHNALWEYMVHGEFASEGGIGFFEILNFFFRFQIWGDVADLSLIHI